MTDILLMASDYDPPALFLSLSGRPRPIQHAAMSDPKLGSMQAKLQSSSLAFQKLESGMSPSLIPQRLRQKY